MSGGVVIPESASDDNNNSSNSSPRIETASSPSSSSSSSSPSSGGGGDGGGGIALWLDMRTAVLPAAQTLKALYDELRQREESRGRGGPDDPDWSLSRVPNPVGALLYAAEPAERPAEEMKALGGGVLPCFRLSGTDEKTRILDVSSGEVAGVGLDPDPAGGGSGGGNQAMEIVAAAAVAGQQQHSSSSSGDLVFLRGARPSVWEDGDMGNVLRIGASACAGAGKTLVVTVRSVGQLHDAAMAAFAASQTHVLGGGGPGPGPASGEEETKEGADSSERRPPAMALLIEPTAELWEAGLLYL